MTGLGALTPLGNNVEETWSALCEGKSGCGMITAFDAEKFKTRFACEVKNFDPSSFMDTKEQRKHDRVSQFSLYVARQAMADSELTIDENSALRTDVVWGTGMAGFQTLCNDMHEFYLGDGTPRFNPFFLPKVIPNMTAGNVSLALGLKGASFSLNSACASSAHAIAVAADRIRMGKADVVLAGGAEAPIAEGGVGGFNALRALSTRNDSPETACRPFSASRDGFVMAEGAACLVLEELEHAQARGAKIYAELVGSGQTSDAFHMTAPDPEGAGAMRAMKEAIDEAGIDITAVDHINTHGTSTPLGDIAELKAIQNLFGEHAYNIHINSTKSMTGHLLGAAGATEAIATILALKNGVVPPTINHVEDDVDEKIDYRLNLTFNKAQKCDLHYGLSNAFGFGGHNASLLFRKW